jgi:hypothetical protein
MDTDGHDSTSGEEARLLDGMLETAQLSAAEMDARQMRRTIRRYCGRRDVSAFAVQ